MHLDSLPAKTRTLLETFAQDVAEISDYLLIGGTALTLSLAHRISEDLDFTVPSKKLNKAQIAQIIAYLEAKGHTAVYNTPQDQLEDAIEHGLDLDDYLQNWLVDGVKVQFFAFCDYDVDRELIAHSLQVAPRLGHVKVADTRTIFHTKCIALTDRIKSRDIFDLWWLMRKVPLQDRFKIDDIFKTAQHYRPNMQYDAIRYRLLDWKLSITDESFETLIHDSISIEQIRLELRAEVSAFESDAARALMPQASAEDRQAP